MKEKMKLWTTLFVTDTREMMTSLRETTGPLGFDIETHPKEGFESHQMGGLIPEISTIRTVQVYSRELNTVWVVDVRKTGLEFMNDLCTRELVIHNTQFEYGHLKQAGITLTNYQCTMLMARVFLGESGLSLADLVEKQSGEKIDKTLQTSDWSAETLSPEQIDYAALDAVLVMDLYDRFTKWFAEHPHYKTAYLFLRDLIEPTHQQMETGLLVDWQAHAEVAGEWKEKVKQAEQTLAEYGLPSDQISKVKAKQDYLKRVLYGDELADWPKTSTGALKCDSDTLKALQSTNSRPELEAIATWSLYTSRLANYGSKYRSLSINGRLVPQYRIAGMAGFRYQCTKPNIQNQPREGFKHIYIAPEGWSFVASDLSQVELRVAGLLSQDPVINKAYADGQDLHLSMAQDMINRMTSEERAKRLSEAGGDEQLLLKRMRTAAKGVNFGLLFGGGARGLQSYVKASYGVNMTLKEAEDAKTLFHQKYAGLTEWQRLIVKHSITEGCTESQYARLTRHFGEREYFTKDIQRDPYTLSMNHPVQSTAFEILALALRYVYEHASTDWLRLSHTVYDELVVVCKEGRETDAARLIHAAFTYGYKTIWPDCSTKGICEVGYGKTWADTSKQLISPGLYENDSH